MSTAFRKKIRRIRLFFRILSAFPAKLWSVRRSGKEVRSMQEKNRENSQKNTQKEPSEQKNQKNDRR